jgi:DNA-binding FrmR family transcriptional regulator
MHTSEQSKKIKTSLKKSIGSINKILAMLETEKLVECSELLIQLDSAIGSLRSVRNQIIEKFLEKCLAENIQVGNIDTLKHQLSKLYKLTK